MEAKKSSYFCLIENCLSVFSQRSDHAEHKSQIEKLPSDLTSEYKFKRKLGSGSFGVVFEVFDRSDKKRKAIKITRNQRNSQEDVVAELKVLKELYHHNLIRYFRSGLCKRNYIFIVMEYCESNLKEFIVNNKPLELEMKDHLFKQLCEGVDFLHNRNDLNQPIIHRDLKPTNILINGDKLRIADFGESKILKTKASNNTTLTGIRGTLLYLPPEILALIDSDEDEQIPPSPSHDIWSLGIIAHEIYSNGQHPFKLPSPNWRRNVEDGKYEIDSLILQNSQMHQIIKGCLENNPQKRLKISEILDLFNNFNKAQAIDMDRKARAIQIKNDELVEENTKLKEREKELDKKIQNLQKENGQDNQQMVQDFLETIKNIETKSNNEIERLKKIENKLYGDLTNLNRQLQSSNDEFKKVTAQFQEKEMKLNKRILGLEEELEKTRTIQNCNRLNEKELKLFERNSNFKLQPKQQNSFESG